MEWYLAELQLCIEAHILGGTIAFVRSYSYLLIKMNIVLNQSNDLSSSPTFISFVLNKDFPW